MNTRPCQTCGKDVAEPWKRCQQCMASARSDREAERQLAFDVRASGGTRAHTPVYWNASSARASRGVKARHPTEYTHDEKCDEMNTRTEYHGDNYPDE